MERTREKRPDSGRDKIIRMVWSVVREAMLTSALMAIVGIAVWMLIAGSGYHWE